MGARRMRRVCGPDLMPTICERSPARGYRHFFYGGAPGVAERLAENLRTRFPALAVAGTYAPPYRALSAEEDAAVVQGRWMADHLGRIQAPVMLGVGAAFDVHARAVRRAPPWMQRSGLEWLFRLLSEPRRLWRRYLVLPPKFVVLVVLQLLGLRR